MSQKISPVGLPYTDNSPDASPMGSSETATAPENPTSAPVESTADAPEKPGEPTELTAEQDAPEPTAPSQEPELPAEDKSAKDKPAPEAATAPQAEEATAQNENGSPDESDGTEQAEPSPAENMPAKAGESPMVPPPPAPPAPPEPPTPDPDPEPEDEPLTLIGHLSELRHRLTRMVIGIIAGFFICWQFAEPAYALLAGPLRAVLPEGSTLIYTGPASAFFVYMKVALVMAIFGTSPYLFYQIWAFVAPGLYKEEQNAILPVALFSAFFFLCGASFCYLLVFPIAFDFFMGFATPDIRPMISIDEYFSFALKMLIAFGLVFEMPLFSYFLSKMRLLTPAFMRKNRKYAILIIFIVAAVLTPPDVFSQTLMAIPMLLLYEVSIYVSIIASKKARPLKSDKTTNPENPETA